MPNDNPVRRFYFSFTMRWGFVGGELGQVKIHGCYTMLCEITKMGI